MSESNQADPIETDRIINMIKSHVEVIMYPLLGLMKMYGDRGISSKSLTDSQVLIIELLYHKDYVDIEEINNDLQIYRLKDKVKYINDVRIFD